MLGFFTIVMVLVVAIVKIVREDYCLIRERFKGFLFFDKYFIDYYLINPSITEPQVIDPHSVLSS
jgi:hypothetical protein